MNTCLRASVISGQRDGEINCGGLHLAIIAVQKVERECSRLVRIFSAEHHEGLVTAKYQPIGIVERSCCTDFRVKASVNVGGDPAHLVPLIRCIKTGIAHCGAQTAWVVCQRLVARHVQLKTGEICGLGCIKIEASLALRWDDCLIGAAAQFAEWRGIF